MRLGWQSAVWAAGLLLCACGDDGAAAATEASTSSTSGPDDSGTTARPSTSGEQTETSGSASGATSAAESGSTAGETLGDGSSGDGSSGDSTSSSSESSGAATCPEGETVECYDGPPEASGVGACTRGVATCNAQGEPGTCEGWVAPAFDGCHTDEDEDCDGATPSCEGNQLWQRVVGSIGVDPWGGAKYGPEGDVYFASYSFNFTYFEPVPDQEVYGGTLHFAHYDPDGELLVATSFGAGDMLDFVIDANGNAYVTGLVDEPTDFGSGVGPASGTFLLKLDATGAVVWDRQFADGVSNFGAALEKVRYDASNDTVLIQGQYSGEGFDLGLGPLPDAVNHDFFTRFDTDGQVLSVDPGYSEIEYFTVSTTGRVALFGVATSISGLTLAGTDVELAEANNYYLGLLDAAGQLESVALSGANDQFSNALGAFAPDGSVWMAGNDAHWIPGTEFNPFDPTFEPGPFMAHYDSSGEYIEHRALGEPIEPRALAVGPAGLPVLVGEFQAGADLGSGPIADPQGVFIAKYLPNLDPAWVRLGTTETDSTVNLRSVHVDGSGRVLVSEPTFGFAALDFGEGTVLGLSNSSDTFVSVFAP